MLTRSQSQSRYCNGRDRRFAHCNDRLRVNDIHLLTHDVCVITEMLCFKKKGMRWSSIMYNRKQANQRKQR